MHAAANSTEKSRKLIRKFGLICRMAGGEDVQGATIGLGEKVGEGDVQGAEGRGRGEGLRRGLKGEVGEYHNESNSCTSSHHSGAMPCNHPTSKASPYHTSSSLTPSYLTLLYPLPQCNASPIQPAKRQQEQQSVK